MNDTIETIEDKQDKGFTLIELLIVIVILGILATVTVFAVAGITDRGQESACDADLKTFEVATEAYFAEVGSYPADQAALVTRGLVRSESNNVSIDGDGGVTLTGDDCVADVEEEEEEEEGEE